MKVNAISPVKNEAENLPELIESVEGQTLRPDEWVIIDDSSTDDSPEIIAETAAESEWIHATDHDSSNYDVGTNVSEVIRSGYRYLECEIGSDPEYYMVLDGDMVLSEEYIEELATFLSKTDGVVMASGGVYATENGRPMLENRSKNQPAGGATLFDSEFIEEIGGFPTVPSWDSAIKAKARIRGYDCRYLSEPDIQAIQSRPTGSKGNQFKNSMMRGSINYQQHLHPIVILLRAGQLSLEKPYYKGVGYLCGYVQALVNKEEKIEDPELREYFWNEKPREIYRRLTKRSA